MLKKEFSISRAVGRGDWNKVIKLEQETLENEGHKDYSYAMIGYAYEQLENPLKAKENYSTALEHNEYCSQALEGLANVYFKEKNHHCTYKYVMKTLNIKQEIDFNVPKPIKYALALVVKLFNPSKSFCSIRKETDRMDQSKNEWKKWAIEYKGWYEKNFKFN